MEPIVELDRAWGTPAPGTQLRRIRQAAERLRERLAAGPRVIAVRTFPLTTLPYLTRHAFWGAARSPAPYVTLTHRCVLVQFFERGELRNLLFNPTDIEAARATPFFARMLAQVGERVAGVLAKTFDPLEHQLGYVGLAPEDIDYVAFDHFHTQDLRGLLGTTDRPPRFPNAKLLSPEIAWRNWEDIHPLQRAWFIPDGNDGVRQDRVRFTNGDLALGDGVLLLRTPGHTAGNQTLFVNTSSGIWGISENGTAADNWSPHESKIPGLAATARRLDLDVLLNANTPESGTAQYTSMILERTLADRVDRAPAFVQMFPSSEVTPSLFAPGLTPTIVHEAITDGEVVRPRVRGGA